jgi:hypothetical protein
MIGYWWTHSSLVSCITYLFIKKKKKTLRLKDLELFFTSWRETIDLGITRTVQPKYLSIYFWLENI